MQKRKRYSERSWIGLVAAAILIFLSTTAAQQVEPEVPFVPTPEKVVAEMLKMAQVGKNDILYDLGCGDGRIVITAAKQFGCRGVGIDIDPRRIRESQKNAAKAGVSNRVQFFQMDLFDAEIGEATVVTLYLLSEVNLRLRPKLLRELRPGTRVVSHEFSMGEWEPDASSSVKTGDTKDPQVLDYWDPNIADYWDLHNVYLWIIPGNVTGTWKLEIPDGSGKKEYTLKLEQAFQQLRAEAFEGSSPIPVFIMDEKIKGNRLQFILERKLKGHTESLHFEGTMQGNTIQGTMRIEGSQARNKIPWTAKRVLSTLRSIIASRNHGLCPLN